MNFSLETVGLLLLSSVYQMGKPQLVAYLQDLHDKDVNWYKAAIYTANAAALFAKTEAGKSSTQLDDAAVADIIDTLTTSASANGITL